MYYRYDVYICHSRRDYTIADNIVRALYAGGFSYYKEQASMETGSDFLQSIINAIDSSRLFLCVLSWNAYSSEFVIKELEYALQRNEITVLPVIVDNSPLPYKLRCLLSDMKIVYWNFSGSLDIADQIKKDVHRALGGENEQKLSTPPIFISYKRLDKDKVFLIVDSIRKETGIDCWIDLEGIESGDQFQNVIIDAIDNADTFVFMLSRNFIAPYRDERTGKIDLRKQTFPEKEVMYALNHGKRMVPVSIDGTTVYDCKWLEFNCSGLDSIDWSDESQRGKLLRNLRYWAGKPTVSNQTVMVTHSSTIAQPLADNHSTELASIPDISTSKPILFAESRKSRIAKIGNLGKFGIAIAAVLLSGLLIWGLATLLSSRGNDTNITYFMHEMLSPSSYPILKDLSSSASANCYIVSQSGTYKFRTVKGNSSEPIGQVASAEVLWETFGTSKAPSEGDLIKSVSFADGFVSFSTADTFREGNAVIAAKDASGTTLWSWHIWFTDPPEGQTYNNGAGVMMDRNLGATSATPGDVGALGLLYQWGRKDPFLNSSSISSCIEVKSTITWPSAVPSSSSTGTINYATVNPTTFITHNRSNFDWYYTGNDSTDDTRWHSSKTIYDPCPDGWRVPDGGNSGVWSKAFDIRNRWETSSNWDSSNLGMNFAITDKKLFPSGLIWYPASGLRNSSNNAMNNVGAGGFYWSVSPNGKNGHTLFIMFNGSVDPVHNGNRANGYSVRCLHV